MKFRTITQEEDSTPVIEDHDLDLRPATLESAKIWAQGTVDEYNRYRWFGQKQLSLLAVEPMEDLLKVG